MRIVTFFRRLNSVQSRHNVMASAAYSRHLLNISLQNISPAILSLKFFNFVTPLVSYEYHFNATLPTKYRIR